METQFTDDEKRFILSEMIKQSRLDVNVLVNLVKGFEPDWLTMPLPHGRTVKQCLQAADDMFQTTVERPDLKRKSTRDLQEMPPKRRIMSNSLEHSAHSSPLTPAAQLPTSSGVRHSSPFTSIQHVNIQPRPARAGPPAPGQTQLAPSAKKRGRPSRADKASSIRPMLPQLAPRSEPLLLAPPAQACSPHSVSGVAGFSHDLNQSPSAPGTSHGTSPGPQNPLKPAKKRGRPSNAEKAIKAASPPTKAPDPDA